MPWHVLLYHDVNWEEGPLMRGIGGTCPPDRFREHVAAARADADIVSPDEAIRRLADSPRDRLVTFWFDDGLAGVRRHAQPILAEFGATGAVAVCSRFYRRHEMFWRFQLSYLASIDGLAPLRRFANGKPLRDELMERFGPEVLDAVGGAFHAAVPEPAQKAAFRVFLDASDLDALRRDGWTLSNHTASHHHVGADRGLDGLEAQFRECDAALAEDFGIAARYWVLPFDRDRSDRLIDRVRALAPERHLVLVGERATTAADLEQHTIHRFTVSPSATGAEVRRLLRHAH